MTETCFSLLTAANYICVVSVNPRPANIIRDILTVRIQILKRTFYFHLLHIFIADIRLLYMVDFSSCLIMDYG